MRHLVLIKHSAPEIVPEIPANQWRLSAAGRARCSGLARHLEAYAPIKLISSTEPKASETAQLIVAASGISWDSMEGLHEHDRSNAPYLSSREFDTTVARFFAEPTKLVFGKETADTARMRFSDAISHVLRQHPAGNLAVVAHGTVITLFVARTNDIDEFRFWKGLGLPALVVLSLPDFRLIAVPEQGED